MLLDYVAANEIHLDEVAELVEGAAAVCRDAGVALVGGETVVKFLAGGPEGRPELHGERFG